MSRIVIAGVGFLGSAVSREMDARGWEVVHVDRAISEDAEGDWLAVDLSVPGAFGEVVNETQPDVLLHMAAVVGRVIGEDDPRRTIEVNTEMTMDAAKACRDAAGESPMLVYASTSEVYGNQGRVVLSEDTPVTLPNNLYGLTKRWGEEAARLYHPGALQIIRPNMPYGPGLPVGRGRVALNNMLWQAATGQPIDVHRGALRSWCWVGDVASGIADVIEHGDVSISPNDASRGVYNVGRDDDVWEMTDVAAKACDLAGADYSLIRIVDPPPNVSPVKRLTMEKLRGLGWEPQVFLSDGIMRVWESYAEWPLPLSGI